MHKTELAAVPGIRRGQAVLLRLMVALFILPSVALAQQAATDDSAPEQTGAQQAPPQAEPEHTTLTCASKPGERTSCPVDTSKGVYLVKTTGDYPCLLGKTWGYDDHGIWVADGCAGEFLAGAAPPPPAKKKKIEYIPNVGFLLYDGENGQINMRLFTYVRYLNQKGLDPSYTDYFGNTHTVVQRQDIQLNKFFLPFSGWFLDPRFRYYLYVWSANTAQGDPAQVVGGGNISFAFNKYVILGGGITSLPSVRSTEGQFPYWLGEDDRLTSDEFFRGSYTTGFWVKGQVTDGLNYMAMIANNLSTLGVSASQLDNLIATQSFMVNWLPTTKEFGLYQTFGDFDFHDKVATRIGVHFTHSREDKQNQPGTDSIENSQIRLTDGSVIFTPDLFGAGITVDKVTYKMSSVDAGVKYRGFSLEAEYYWRWLSNFAGTNTGGIANINDHGFQAQSSAMVVPKFLQAYLSGSEIQGHYGDGSEVRAGVNWYPVGKRGFRTNGEWIHLNHCPVGYTAVPYPVGGNGDVFHVNIEMNF
jgi:hypothetical protein